VGAPRKIQASIVPAERNPVLREFFFARSACDVLIGPLGSAKTYTTMQKILAVALDQAPNPQGIRPTRGGILRNTWPELERVVLEDIKRFFLPMGARITHGIPPTFALEMRLPDRTVLKLDMDFVAGLDQADSEEKLRGYQWTWVWGNEGRQIPLGVFGMAIARTGRFPSPATEGVGPTWMGGMIDTNAFDVDHGLYALMKDPPRGWRFHVQPPGVTRAGPNEPWVVNPLREYPPDQDPEYYSRISAGRPDDWIRVNLANEFIFHAEGRPVYPQYQDAVHCPGPILADPGLPLRLGFDFGRTPAMTVSQYFTAVARWQAVAELTTENEPAAEFAPRAKAFLDAHFPGYAVAGFGDPAGDREGQTLNVTPIQILEAAGISCRPAYTNDALLRRAALSKPMTRLAMDGRPAFQISSAMKKVRKGLQGAYVYARIGVRGKEQYRDVPEKSEWSHPIDALEYSFVDVEGRGAMRPHYPGADRERSDWPEFADSEWT
jgi:hypothetical protein